MATLLRNGRNVSADSRPSLLFGFVPILALLAILFLAVAPAVAQQGLVKVELNKLEPGDAACQAFLLIENTTPTSFESLTLDLVMFDPDGIISRRLAVEMAPVRSGKTSVKVFNIEGLACTGVSRILVNDVLSCNADGTARKDCLDVIETASRGSVELIK